MADDLTLAWTDGGAGTFIAVLGYYHIRLEFGPVANPTDWGWIARISRISDILLHADPAKRKEPKLVRLDAGTSHEAMVAVEVWMAEQMI